MVLPQMFREILQHIGLVPAALLLAVELPLSALVRVDAVLVPVDVLVGGEQGKAKIALVTNLKANQNVHPCDINKHTEL